MVKKVLSFFLATMLIMSVLSVAAVDANSATIYADSFDDLQTGSVAIPYGGGSTDAWAMSDANASALYTYQKANVAMEVVADGENNNVMKVSNNSTFVLAMNTAKKDSLAADETIYASFKVKFPRDTPNGYWCFGDGTKTILCFQSWGSTLNLWPGDGTTANGVAPHTAGSKDHWYTVLIKISNTELSGYIYKEDGTLAKSATLSVGAEGDVASVVGVPTIFKIINGGSNNSAMYLDDTKYIVAKAGQKMNFVSSSLPANPTELTTFPTNVDLEFDLPVGAASLSGITCKANGSDTSIVTSTKVLSGNKVRVALGNVEKGKTYTIDFPGVTSEAGNTLSTEKTSVTFSTSAKSDPEIDYSDSFETGAVSDEAYVSDVWKLSNSGASSSYSNDPMNASLSIETIGSNRVMKVVRDKTTGGFRLTMTDSVKTIPADSTVYASFKAQVPRTVPSGTRWLIGIGRTPLVKLMAGQEGTVVTETKGEWYDMQEATTKVLPFASWVTFAVKVTGTTVNVKVFSEAGELVLDTTKTGTFNGIPAIFHPNDANSNENFVLYLDDSRYMVMKSGNTVEYVSSTIADGAENVGLLSQTVDLKFTTPIALPALQQITCKAAGSETSVVTEAALSSYDTLRLTLAALEGGKTYTIDFSNIMGDLNNTIYGKKSISFTSKPTPEGGLIVTKLDTLINDGVVLHAQTLVVHNVGQSDYVDAEVLVAVYGSMGELLGVEPRTVTINANGGSATIILAHDYSGVAGVRVFVFNNKTDIKPLSSTFDEGSIWD